MPLFAALIARRARAAVAAHPRDRLRGSCSRSSRWGVLADFLKNIAITSGPLVASQTGFAPWQREAIAFAYQFGSLILPTVVPAVAWVLTHRAFLERMRRT